MKFGRQIEEARMLFRHRRTRIESYYGFLFASPWFIGLTLFTAFPIGFSIVLSFCEWDPNETIDKAKFVGLANYIRAFTDDPLIWLSLYNTFFYAFFAVPLGLTMSLILAMLLNQEVRGIALFRTLFYIPSVVGGVATSILWLYIFNPLYGPLTNMFRAINRMLFHAGVEWFSLPEPMWIYDPHWAKPSLILMHVWASGGATMLIFLAGLQGVPHQLYEVADLDGASRFRKFWSITIPMISPTIFFNFVMGVIASFQVFMQAFVMGGENAAGGANNSLLFYVLYLYRRAFVEFQMGYASAMAWILFAIIMIFTLLILRSSALWVYYEGENN